MATSKHVHSPSSPAPRGHRLRAGQASAPRSGFDLVVAADEPAIQQAADAFRGPGRRVDAAQADLATIEGVDGCARVARPAGGCPARQRGSRPGPGLPRPGLQRRRHVIDTNVTGTLYLIQKVGRDMRARGQGRILITGSIAGFMPGTFRRSTTAPRRSRLVLVRAAGRAQGHRRDRDLPDAGRHRDRFLRACRHARHQGRPGEEGRPGRRRQGRLRRHDARRRRRGQRLEEQAAAPPSPTSRRPGACRAAPQAWLRRARRRRSPRTDRASSSHRDLSDRLQATAP